MENIRITLIQTCLYWGDRTKNLKNFEKKIENVETDLIILPEMFSTGFITSKLYTIAEVMYGPSFNWMLKTASKLNAHITGSLIIRDNNEYYNRLIWMKPDGDFEYYDKKHLFRMGDEDKQFSGGNNKIYPSIKGWNFLPLICYDLRFPVWSRNSFKNNKFDYDVLLYVANWPEDRRSAWNSLLTARAIENQAYVIGLNRVGSDKNNSYKGDSYIIDSYGKTVLSLEKDSLATIELKYESLKNHRENFKVSLDWD